MKIPLNYFRPKFQFFRSVDLAVQSTNRLSCKQFLHFKAWSMLFFVTLFGAPFCPERPFHHRESLSEFVKIKTSRGHMSRSKSLMAATSQGNFNFIFLLCKSFLRPCLTFMVRGKERMSV